MIEPEIAFCDIEGDMACAEQCVTLLLSTTSHSPHNACCKTLQVSDGATFISC
jgi:hypothetical protein